MNGIEDYIPDLAKLLGVEPSTALLIVGLLIALMNLGGRLIPDDATGWLGFVRKICKLVGLYASNRITSKLTVNKIAETTVPIVNELGEQIERVKRSEEHTSELQSLMRNSYAVFCLKTKKQPKQIQHSYHPQTE